jgi:hypothetical protein
VKRKGGGGGGRERGKELAQLDPNPLPSVFLIQGRRACGRSGKKEGRGRGGRWERSVSGLDRQNP